jgi:hypothetical protein
LLALHLLHQLFEFWNAFLDLASVGRVGRCRAQVGAIGSDRAVRLARKPVGLAYVEEQGRVRHLTIGFLVVAGSVLVVAQVVGCGGGCHLGPSDIFSLACQGGQADKEG